MRPTPEISVYGLPGFRKIHVKLRAENVLINRKRTRRLYRMLKTSLGKESYSPHRRVLLVEWDLKEIVERYPHLPANSIEQFPNSCYPRFAVHRA